MDVFLYYIFTILILIINFSIIFFIDNFNILSENMYVILFIILCIPYVMNIRVLRKKTKNYSRALFLPITMFTLIITYLCCAMIKLGDTATLGYSFIFALLVLPLGFVIGLFIDTGKEIKTIKDDKKISTNEKNIRKTDSIVNLYWYSCLFVMLYYFLFGIDSCSDPLICRFEREYGLMAVVNGLLHYFKITFYFFIPCVVYEIKRYKITRNMNDTENIEEL
ncbi:MAG: hypothetical protein R3Y13_02000 [bacterium]